MLKIVEIERKDVYITNVVKCYPPNNQPSENSIIKCAKYLDAQLSLINPKIIITLGELATREIFRRFKLKFTSMSNLHGKVFEVDSIYGKKKIIVMFHPASALYNAALKETIIEDWKKIKNILHEE